MLLTLSIAPSSHKVEFPVLPAEVHRIRKAVLFYSPSA